MAVVFCGLMRQLRIGFFPCFEVIGSEGPKLIVFEVDEIVTIGNTAFGDMSTELAAKHTVQFAGGQVGIVLQHSIDKLVHAVQTSFLRLELEQFFELQDFTTFEDGLVLVVDDGIAIGFIFGTMENEINTKLLFHHRSKFFFVGSHVAVLQEDGSELFPSLFIGFESLAMLLDDVQWQGLDNVPITLDTKIIILGIALVTAGFKDGLELVDGRETVLQSLLDGIGSPLFQVLAHNAVDDFLRTDAFLIVVYLVAIGSHTARH